MFSFSEAALVLGTQYYFSILFLILLFYIILEISLPLYPAKKNLLSRWVTNLGLFFICVLVTYGLVYGLSYDEKSLADLNMGLFKQLDNVPFLLQFLVLVLFADFCFFAFHFLSHHWRPLWRLHLVHHTGLDMDSTTTLRIHPLGYLLNLGLRGLILVLLGVPFWLLLVFDLVHIAHDFYAHSNIKLPTVLEQKLRLIIVTSDMHRIHHGAEQYHTNSNYGIIFSFWDRLFHTYHFLDIEQQKQMPLGLEYYRKESEQGLWETLKQPFSYEFN